MRISPTDCEICRFLCDEVRAGAPGTQSRLPLEAQQLETLADHDVFERVKLKRCPLCGTYYRYEYDQDRDHWWRNAWETLRRMSEAGALDMLRGDSESLEE